MPKKESFTTREIVQASELRFKDEQHSKQVAELMKRIRKEQHKRRKLQRRIHELEMQISNILHLIENLEETKISIHDLSSSAE